MIDHEKKNRSVFRNVSFQIEPSKDEANCYTIYNPQTVGTNSTKEPITDHLNRKYKEMLHGWVAEKRQRENGSGAFDMYYYHKSKQCRSLVEVRKYVFRGLSKLEVDQEITEVKEVEVIENHSMKRKAERSILERKSATKKQKSNNYGKREVKKFLGGAMNNLMNRNVKHKNKDVGMSEEDSSPKRKIESSILEGEPGIKDQIRILFTPKEKYKREYFLNNLNWCWNHKVQQIVGGLVGDDHRASNGANGGSNEGGRGCEDDSGRI